MYVAVSPMYLKKVPKGPSLLNDSDKVHSAPDGDFSPIVISIAMPKSG